MKLRLLDPRPRFEDIKAGDCWFVPELDEQKREDGSPYLATTRAQRGRPPLEVCLAVVPKGGDRCMDWPLTFVVDSRVSQPPHNGWQVSGDAPNVTVHPSIFMNRGEGDLEWHGWLKDGVLTRC